MMLRVDHLVVCVVTLCFCCGLEANSSGQELPELSYKERIALASKMVAPYKKLLESDLAKNRSLSGVFDVMVELDKPWVLANINKWKKKVNFGVYVYALRDLLLSGEVLSPQDEQKLLSLVREGPSIGLLFSAYTFDRIPEKFKERRRVHLVQSLKEKKGRIPLLYYGAMASRIHLAKKLGVSYPKELEEEIRKYLKSDRPQKDFENLERDHKKQFSGSRNVISVSSWQKKGWENRCRKLMSYYPECGLPIKIRSSLSEILNDSSKSKAEKIRLVKKHYPLKTEFRNRLYELEDVTYFAEVCELDHRLALDYANSCHNQLGKVWGKVLIAGLLAKKNPKVAKECLLDAYQNHPLGPINSHAFDEGLRAKLCGLRVVKHCFPGLVDPCVAAVKEELSQILEAGKYNKLLGSAIPVLITEDPEYAKELFAKIDQMAMEAREVPSFLAALAVMDPERIPVELDQLPTQHYYFHINAMKRVIPFLTNKKSNKDYRLLVDTSFLYYPKNVEKKIYGK